MGGRAKPDLRVPLALEIAFQAHQGLTWPGSDIPLLAHPLEVASRVATWGGSDDQILAGMLHDLPECLGYRAAVETIAPFGGGLQAILLALWTGGQLPVPGSFPFPPSEDTDPLFQRILACDALCHIRGLAQDWNALAHGWEEREKTEHYQKRVMDIFFGRPPSPSRRATMDWESQLHRLALCHAYRGWYQLPFQETPPPLAVLSLAKPSHPYPTHLETWCRSLESWNLPDLAEEMDWIGQRLGPLVKQAHGGFLLAHTLDPPTYRPEVVKACLGHMSQAGLAGVLVCPRSGPFRAHVPKALQESCLAFLDPCSERIDHIDDLQALQKALETIAVGREIVLQARLLEGSSSAIPYLPLSDRFLQTLQETYASHCWDPWPLTTIPQFFHALEAMTLALQQGCDETTALIALQFPWQEPQTPDQEFSHAQSFAIACVQLSRQRFLIADRASLSPSQERNPYGRRKELQSLLPIFQAMFKGRSESEVRSTLLVEGRLSALRVLDEDGWKPWDDLDQESEVLHRFLMDSLNEVEDN